MFREREYYPNIKIKREEKKASAARSVYKSQISFLSSANGTYLKAAQL
jgi:hypothetical protein